MGELIGRFHPLIVHLPIGILVLAFLMELVSRFSSQAYLKQSLGFVIKIAFASACLSSFTGWIMPKMGEFDESLLQLHFWSAIALTATTLLLYITQQAKAGILKRFTFRYLSLP